MQGKRETARKLLERGHSLNTRDAAILQVPTTMAYKWHTNVLPHGIIVKSIHLSRSVQLAPAGWFFICIFMMNSMGGEWGQAWALLEEEDGNIDFARQLLERGSKADPSHLYIWQASLLLPGSFHTNACKALCHCSCYRVGNPYVALTQQLGLPNKDPIGS